MWDGFVKHTLLYSFIKQVSTRQCSLSTQSDSQFGIFSCRSDQENPAIVQTLPEPSRFPREPGRHRQLLESDNILKTPPSDSRVTQVMNTCGSKLMQTDVIDSAWSLSHRGKRAISGKQVVGCWQITEKVGVGGRGEFVQLCFSPLF